MRMHNMLKAHHTETMAGICNTGRVNEPFAAVLVSSGASELSVFYCGYLCDRL